ncbi:peptidoglycan DD-metalloendopeptidase family protein [Aliikangiella sp. IMCC44632]
MSRSLLFRYHKTSVLFAAILAGCGTHAPAPVYDLYASDSALESKQNISQAVSHLETISVRPNEYTVVPGDTLFSIAWENAIDVDELIAINQLKNNLIYPGQKLQFERAVDEKLYDHQSLIAALNQEILQHPINLNENPGKTRKNTARELATGSKKSNINLSNTKNIYANKQHKGSSRKGPQQKLAVSHARKSQHGKQSKQTKALAKSQQVRANASINWIWPTDGQIVGKFSSRLNANRGLDIAAKKGQPVRATAPGQVVYKGNGLKGYGNLVIIKHDNNYLSAYAHNEKIHVSENEFVNAGQRIADVGSSGTQSDKLHFEIRYKGKPVDPLNYLPEKN